MEWKNGFLLNTDVKAGTYLRTKLFANSSCTKCVYVWMGLWTCTISFANSLHTIWHDTKFVRSLCKHKGNCVRCLDRFFHALKPHTCCLHFLHFFNMDWSMFVECMLKLILPVLFCFLVFFQYRLVDVHWECALTLWFALCSPHICGKLGALLYTLFLFHRHFVVSSLFVNTCSELNRY